MVTKTAGRSTSTPVAPKCPPWCVIDHSDDTMSALMGDFIHRSDFAWLRPDGSRSGDEGPWEVAAQLVSSDEDGTAPAVAVDLGDTIGPYAELTVETADQFLRDLKTFTARVQQMRDQLAAMKEQQS
jgi:hypothetical protein